MMGKFRICLSERLFLDALEEWRYWTGHINPDTVTCTGCQDEVKLASNGDHYNTTVHTDHTVRYNNGHFCANFDTSSDVIEGLQCPELRRYACEFTCHNERKYKHFMRLTQ